MFIVEGMLYMLFTFLIIMFINIPISEIIKKHERKLGIRHVNLNVLKECNHCGFVNNEYFLLNYNLDIGKLSSYKHTNNYECPVCTESKGHRFVDLSLNKTFALKRYNFIDHIKLIIKLNRIEKDKINNNTRDFEIKQLTIIQDQLNNTKYVVKDGILTVEKIKEDKDEMLEKNASLNQINSTGGYELRGGIGNKIIKKFYFNKQE